MNVVFSIFFNAFGTELENTFRHKLTTFASNEQQAFTQLLTDYFCADQDKEGAPWPALLIRILPFYSAKQLAEIQTSFERLLPFEQLRLPAVLAYSYLTLLTKKGQRGMKLLMEQAEPYYPQDVEAHFELLKKRSALE